MSRDFRAFPTSTTKTFRIAVVFLILPHLGNVDGGQCSNSIQEDNDRKPRLIAVTEPVQHGEGPHWDAHNQLLYFVDISGNTVHRLNPSTNMHSAITLNDSVSFVIPIRGRVNQFIIGLGRSLAVLHWDGFSPTFQVFVKESVDNDRPNNRFNDAKADPWGRLWTGNRRIIFDFIINNVPGNPDGMTIDRWNMLWIACWGGSRVIQVDPQRSQLLKTILMPVERVTSVTFGGALLDILYVTSMRTGLNETQLKSQPMAGTTFAVTNLGTRGTINNPAQFYCVHRKRLKHYSG
ncbi:regucalcin isoform X2 [Nilaparvata lugens]|uniref:regucalcin isoform X2 n=1 Tax=Nilaparvata lugens TaxID=108931 RepID=UPI00193E9E7D|nr:regucalcin isoform X2 [Nilaparvata lugens]